MAARVVVTGIGLVTPLGAGREESWDGLRNGRSAVRWLEHDSLGEERRQGSEPESAGAPAAIPTCELTPYRDPVVRLAETAAQEAVKDARLLDCGFDRLRAGCVIGTSKGGLQSAARLLRNSRRDWSDAADAVFWSQCPPSASASQVSQAFGLEGPCLCPVAACATGLVSIIRGMDLIRDGTCDIVLAGSTDASLEPAVLASFRRLGVLARIDGDPATAVRPFDRRRSGFLVGEGAAVLVLERWESALARGAAIYGELVGAGLAGDAAGLTQLDPQGAALTRLIGDVLARAGLPPDSIDYVNLHGTATRQNDAVESRAIHAAFGPAARRVSCSSMKGGIGHLLGAAGSVELAATLLAIRDQVVPPTVNLTDPDPSCGLDATPVTARQRTIDTALKLSLGFGGHLAAVVVRRVDERREEKSNVKSQR